MSKRSFHIHLAILKRKSYLRLKQKKWKDLITHSEKLAWKDNMDMEKKNSSFAVHNMERC